MSHAPNPSPRTVGIARECARAAAEAIALAAQAFGPDDDITALTLTRTAVPKRALASPAESKPTQPWTSYSLSVGAYAAVFQLKMAPTVSFVNNVTVQLFGPVAVIGAVFVQL